MNLRTLGLWRQHWIDNTRVNSAPKMTRIIVALDYPAHSPDWRDNEFGLIVAGLGEDHKCYIIEDRSSPLDDPMDWAKMAVRFARKHDATIAIDGIPAELDFGRMVLNRIDHTVPVRATKLERGSYNKAFMASMLYSEGRVHHVGCLPELERDMCNYCVDRFESNARLDALVLAIWTLMLAPRQISDFRAI